MATRQEGQVQTPLEIPMWVSLTWDVFQSMSPGPPNRPKALVCTTPMEMGCKLLKLPNPELWVFCGSLVPTEALIQPGQMKAQDGQLGLCE